MVQRAINDHAQSGWEFYRSDTYGVAVAPGCLGALFAAKHEYTQYGVLTFRRPSA
ncbi:1,4-dihydroxy-2-naphthoate octaprenyltransferase [Deinococcus metallilatus]|uniref:1,4-dihydroxy-2-naphthoate octaprenyltransferase n=1 Tax=Deinococcus metallilatus TaxID=1211322 RepID=A0ABR6MVK9_9DEIO|nr:1,4-dihydroxy-2-naphthoate octaprenyltransferase [Deinococcus metallilatus]